MAEGSSISIVIFDFSAEYMLYGNILRSDDAVAAVGPGVRTISFMVFCAKVNLDDGDVSQRYTQRREQAAS
jgi:hypothetical protein